MNPIIGILVVLLLVVAVVGSQTPVFALKNFFNCMTTIANQNHQLTVDDVNTCYHKEFKHSQ